MAESEAAAIAERLWRAIGASDWQAARDLVHDDFVQEWPQSGERIEGPDDAFAIDRNFPGGLPQMRLRRTSGAGDLGVLELELTYSDGSVYDCVAIVEVREGKVVRETDYFAAPFDAPQWRASWVRRIPR